MHPPNTISCKPIVISCCQQFLKSKIHKFKFTTHYAYKLLSQPWDSSHEVWLFHMVDSGLCHGLTLIAMLQTIFLKLELQSAKHLVSLDVYNLFPLLQQSLKHFQNYKIEMLLAVSISIILCNHCHTKTARYSHIIYAI